MTKEELLKLRYLLDLYLLFEIDPNKIDLESYYFLLDTIDYKLEGYIKERFGVVNE